VGLPCSVSHIAGFFDARPAKEAGSVSINCILVEAPTSSVDPSIGL